MKKYFECTKCVRVFKEEETIQFNKDYGSGTPYRAEFYCKPCWKKVKERKNA